MQTGTESDGTDRAASWRGPLAAASVIAAAAHVPVTGEHLEEALYIGVLFIALEVVSVALAVVVLLRPSRTVYGAIAVVGALAVAALVVSRTIGLPLIQDDIGNWTEPLATVSVVAEAVMAVGGGIAAMAGVSSPGRTTRFGLVAGVIILTLGMTATGFAAAAESGDADQDMPGMDMPGMHMGLPGLPSPEAA